MKTTLRYLLIVMSLVSVLSIKAQGTAQLPQAQMKSTSVMVSSGSTLPQAAVTGTFTADETSVNGPKKGIRRSTLEEDDDPFGGETIGGTDNPIEPGTPIGDAMWPLILAAAVYGVYRRKRV